MEGNPRRTREEIGLPIRPFLFTLDQIATLIATSPSVVRSRYTFFEGRTVGKRQADRLLARNIANPGEDPDWRVAEAELIRWLRRKGFRFYERGYGVS